MTATLCTYDSDWRAKSICDTTADLHFADVEELIEQGMNPEAAEVEATARTAKAKAICGNCPVIKQCRDDAFLNEEAWGTWGGLDAEERRSLRAGWLQTQDVSVELPLPVVKDQDQLSPDPAANKKLMERRDRVRKIRDAVLLQDAGWFSKTDDMGTHDRNEHLMVLEAFLANPSQNAATVSERFGRSKTWATRMLSEAEKALGLK